VFYVTDQDEDGNTMLNLAASYAFNNRKHLANKFKLREGLIGQCAYEKSRILLTNVPSDYVQISSGLGEAPPLNVIVLPALFEGDVNAVIELASFSRFSETHQSFLNQLMESIGIVLNTIAANMRTEGLLKQSQLLTSELQAQQEELKKTNDRLEQQANTLRQSEELLRTKQDELQRTNAELEDKARLLSAQNMQVEAKNREVEQAKRDLEEKAEQLALTSKYKSEFLANMSHELRTPLNSLLILSKLLSENTQGNLTDKQVEFARSIHHAGSDLLGLINDILDLSKIESGTVTLDIGETSFTSLRDHMDRTFSQIAQDKKLDFVVELDPDLPRSMYTDDKRVQQVIKNLLSNAFKFTEKGGVRLRVARVKSGWSTANDRLSKAGPVIAFSVHDTGIGIPEEKQRIIFEAFQQADGTTSRKYGGTGLGLSISREITRLLGGELTVQSTPHKGSVFTLYLPLNFMPATAVSQARAATVQTVRAVTAPTEAQEPLLDDRDAINRGDAVVLIVEDDQRFATILLTMARESGFKGIVTGEGSSVVPLAKRFRPDAITLDIGLPDMDGFALLDLLKRNPETRHIPVHVISADEEDRLGLSIGAYGYSGKPVERDAIIATLDEVKTFGRRSKRLLAIEPTSGGTLRNLFGEDDVEVESATTLGEAEQAILDNGFDCVVLDLSTPAGEPLGDLVKVLTNSDEPLVVFLPREANEEERMHINQLSRRSEPVRLANSTAQLQDHIALILHRPFENLPLNAQAALQQLRRCDPLLANKKVVVIDDDIRNIFSLTSALEEHGVELHYAESGRSGIEILQRLPDADAVLVDIMMPGMDGYQTMQEIRAMPEFGTLPIIAVTAKAMKGDRQKCIDAGASDYVAKPVDIDQLVSVLRVWFQRAQQTTPAIGTAGDNVVTFRSVAGQN
jgi:signal transduction histidine kinase/DNA-binding response OmpR family regulator